MLLWRSLPLVTFLLVAQLNFALLAASYAARGRMKLQAAHSASNNADTGCPTAGNTLLMAKLILGRVLGVLGRLLLIQPGQVSDS